MSLKQYPCFPAAGRPIELLGLTGPFILALAFVLLSDFLLFVVLYCLGLTPAVDGAIALVLGATGWVIVLTLSKHFGAHGLSKHFAARRLPQGLRLAGRHTFLQLKKTKQ